MNDNARLSLEHARQKGAVKSDGGEQVDIKDILPVLIGEHLESARLGIRGTEIIHQNVDPAPLAFNAINHLGDSGERAEVGLYKQKRGVIDRGRSSRSGCNQGTAQLKALHGGGADALGTPGNQDALAFELLR